MIQITSDLPGTVSSLTPYHVGYCVCVCVFVFSKSDPTGGSLDRTTGSQDTAPSQDERVLLELDRAGRDPLPRSPQLHRAAISARGRIYCTTGFLFIYFNPVDRCARRAQSVSRGRAEARLLFVVRCQNSEKCATFNLLLVREYEYPLTCSLQ